MSEPVRRLFFALWPDQVLRSQLSEVTRHARRKLSEAGARTVDTANIHITLAFLGNVPDGQYQCVARSAGRVQASRFDLLLDRWGFFRRAQVCYLTSAAVPGELERLVGRLWDVAESCGLKPDPRPYQPHLTLARKVTARLDLPAPESVLWTPADFVLVSSETRSGGPVYRVLQRWPLIAAGRGNGPHKPWDRPIKPGCVTDHNVE
ncbi:MAG: RNA 2',3'-cyclic phosphodiesterase [Gammaproteobacteria bacterium]|nr:RNA 2',3'-cyclic phosphodiesterase [Gammaproteobacteria bacterium]MCZ6763013.1 RNA 2',3'-cyclic phosphodiesterase [Gammaproteobacteria bacterium]MCZ6881144.1 RNA 2',3'-cyclic phosphodiesterase [Gammaproteobacteria bacterium]